MVKFFKYYSCDFFWLLWIVSLPYFICAIESEDESSGGIIADAISSLLAHMNEMSWLVNNVELFTLCVLLYVRHAEFSVLACTLAWGEWEYNLWSAVCTRGGATTSVTYVISKRSSSFFCLFITVLSCYYDYYYCYYYYYYYYNTFLLFALLTCVYLPVASLVSLYLVHDTTSSQVSWVSGSSTVLSVLSSFSVLSLLLLSPLLIIVVLLYYVLGFVLTSFWFATLHFSFSHLVESILAPCNSAFTDSSLGPLSDVLTGLAPTCEVYVKIGWPGVIGRTKTFYCISCSLV